jgi:predicted Zn-dependent protease
LKIHAWTQRKDSMTMPTANIDPGRLTDQVRGMVQGGRLRAARPLLAALRKAMPSLAALDELEARLLLREGRASEALATLDRAVGDAPASVALRLCRVEARMQLDDLAGAADDAAQAVILAPGGAPAKAILGVVLIELNRLADAIACLAEAVAQDPANAAYRLGLAQAQERAGDAAAAGATLDDGIARAPGDCRLRVAAIMVAMRQQAFATAIALAEAARQAGVADACVFGLLGQALSQLGQADAARQAYGEALKLAPEKQSFRRLADKTDRLPPARSAPPLSVLAGLRPSVALAELG